MEPGVSPSTNVGRLEALLFIYGDSLDCKKAVKLLSISAEDLAIASQELRAQLDAENRGLTLIEHEGNLQLVTKPKYGDLMSLVLRAEMNEALSPASLETLSIIAYAGPVGRAEIDYIRGVNSSFTLRALLLRGLIDRDTDPERANAYRYKPSIELMHHLGISKLSDLPEFERFRTLVASLKQSQSNVSGTEPVSTGESAINSAK